MKKTAIFLALCFLLTMAGCVPQQTAAAEEELRIGILFPFSGVNENFGKLGSMGASYYAENYFIEKAGGFKNKPNLKIKLVYGDTESSNEVAVSEFERLVNVEKVHAVVGPYASGSAAALVPLAVKYETPFQVIGAVSQSVVSTNNEFVYRAGPADAFEFQNHLKMIQRMSDKSENGIKKVGIIYTADDRGISVSTEMRKAFAASGYELVVDETVEVGASDLSGAVQRIRREKPDVMVVTLLLNEAIIYYRQCKEYGLNVPSLASGHGVIDPSFPDAAGEEAEYVIASTFLCADSLNYFAPEDMAYVQQMIDKFEMQPNETCAVGWLGMGCLLQAIDNADSLAGPDIAKAMAALEIDSSHPANLLTQYARGVKYADEGGRYNQNIYADGMQYQQLIDSYWTWIGPTDIPGVNDKLVFPVPEWEDR